jgi:hypothetical protein
MYNIMKEVLDKLEFFYNKVFMYCWWKKWGVADQLLTKENDLLILQCISNIVTSGMVSRIKSSEAHETDTHYLY